MGVESIDIVVGMWLIVRDIVLGGFGGAAVYLFDYSKATRNGDSKFTFRISSLLINIVLGMFVAYAVSGVIENEQEYRDVLLLASGFSAYNVLTLTESKFAEYMFSRFTGIPPGDRRKAPRKGKIEGE